VGILKKEYHETGRTAVLNGLDEIAGLPDANRLLGGSLEAELLGPLPVYSVTGTDFDEREMKSLRYLIWDEDRDEIKSIADVDADEELGEVTTDAFTGITSGRSVKLLSNAMTFVEEKFSNLDEEFEIKILEIPSANSAAIWIHGKEKDFFVPYLNADILSENQRVEIDESYEDDIQSLLSEYKDAGTTLFER